MPMKTPLEMVTTDGKLLSKIIARIATMTTTINTDKSVAAASCAMVAIEHGNITPFKQLLAAIGDTDRKSALVRWACTFAPVTFDKVMAIDEKTGKEIKITTFLFDRDRAQGFKDQSAIDRVAFVSSLLQTPYWEHTREAELKPFNIHTALVTLLNRAKKANDNGVKGNYIVGLEQIEALAKSLKPGDTRSTDEIPFAKVA